MVTIINTLMMLASNFALVGSTPWKQPYWKNTYITIVLIFNFVLNILITLTPWFGFLGYQALDPKDAGITFLIGCAFVIIIILYN